MAKVGNPQSGNVGKLDGQVYYKGADGKTVVRKITVPKNPKTLAQRVQRVIAKTVTENYKVMKAICDHSFEGKSMGAQCSNRFRQLNMQHLRSRAAYLQEQGISLSTYYNFIGLGTTLSYAPGAMYVSEGSLRQVFAGIDANLKGQVVINGNTYGDVINALGARRGDQMTFVTIEKDANGNYSFNYARVILDPRNGNGAAALTEAFVVDGLINCPNSRNRGAFAGLVVEDDTLKFKLTNGSVIACGIIMSRREGDKWFRSTCQLALSEVGLGDDKLSLLDAASTDEAVALDLDSEAYLNNAGEGGTEGSSSSVPSGPVVTTINDNATINGASQSIAGGSVAVSQLSSITITGENLDHGLITCVADGETTVEPSSATATAMSWAPNLGPGTHTFVFKKGMTTFLTIMEGGSSEVPGEG